MLLKNLFQLAIAILFLNSGLSLADSKKDAEYQKKLYQYQLKKRELDLKWKQKNNEIEARDWKLRQEYKIKQYRLQQAYNAKKSKAELQYKLNKNKIEAKKWKAEHKYLEEDSKDEH